MSNDKKPQLNVIKSADEKKVTSLKELSIADHVVFDFGNQNYVHALVVEVSLEKNELFIIFYDDGSLGHHFRPFENFVIFDKTSTTNEDLLRQGVKELNIHVDLNKFDLYKLIYNQEVEPNLEPSETLTKASDLLGKEKYNVFVNSDEHFAGYCKTGKAGRLFILDPDDVNLRNILGGTIYDRIEATLRSTGMNVLLVQTAKHIAATHSREIIASELPRLIQVSGSLVGIGIESILIGKDINNKYKEKLQGKIDEIKFKKYVAKRISRGALSFGFGVGGSMLGQYVLPVPVVGAVVGGLVGGVVGAVVGQTNGILIGEIIEKVDNRAKLKKRKELQKEFRIVQNLVWKYDQEAIRNFFNNDMKQNENNETVQSLVSKPQPFGLSHDKFFCPFQAQNLDVSVIDDYDVFLITCNGNLFDTKGPQDIHEVFFKLF